ncbi:MAG TPA: hypothetical protein DDZ80_23885, partial [Cyanobacteria bacterium UBA8803]|nr:hypothetical protein [Cyanobacteria bacterium UBA8803]
VWEWCADTWHNNYQGTPSDGRGGNDHTFKLMRGGSWFNNPGYCRCGFRYYSYSARDIYNSIGFRVINYSGL